MMLILLFVLLSVVVSSSIVIAQAQMPYYMPEQSYWPNTPGYAAQQPDKPYPIRKSNYGNRADYYMQMVVIELLFNVCFIVFRAISTMKVITIMIVQTDLLLPRIVSCIFLLV
jgi:hypothetical protein